MRRRAIWATGVVVVVIAAIAIGSVIVKHHASNEVGPLAVGGIDQPGVGTASCTTLMTAMPTELGTLQRRTLDAPGPAGVAAFGDPAVILRCGVPTPDQLTCSSDLIAVNGVSWLEQSAYGQTTYLTVDRAVRVALTLPDATMSSGVGNGVIAQISNIIAAKLPYRAVCDANAQLIPPDGGDG